MFVPDFSDVRGQHPAVIALVNAAGPRTPVILTGPPGIGKTMLARRAPGLLGPLADRERVWLRDEYGSIGIQTERDPARPFRAPHHTVSAAAMGGAVQRKHRITCPQIRVRFDGMPAVMPPRCDCEKLGGLEPVFRPGECHLARFGILFLDEVHEFGKLVLDTIAATLDRMALATRPWLIVATTPCACGWRGATPDTGRVCACTPESLARWDARAQYATGRLRIGARADVAPMSLDHLRAAEPGVSTADLRARVVDAVPA